MIHPTAIVGPHCELADDVEIGPFAVLAGKVKLDAGTKVGAHAIIGCETGTVEMGRDNIVHPHAFVGGPPQDISYKGDLVHLKIGDRNIFREFCSINLGTYKEKGTTVIGSDCMIMAYVHIAHDCQIGDRVIIANTTNFAGHVRVENDVRIGGNCNFAQFIRLGRFAYIAGTTTANKDILPYTIAEGKWATCRATNRIGLERSGMSKEKVNNIHKAIRALVMGTRTLDEAVEKIKADCVIDAEIQELLDFISSSEKGIAR